MINFWVIKNVCLLRMIVLKSYFTKSHKTELIFNLEFILGIGTQTIFSKHKILIDYRYVK